MIKETFKELPPLLDTELETKRQQSIINSKLELQKERERQKEVKEKTEEIISWGKPIPEYKLDEIERMCLE